MSYDLTDLPPRVRDKIRTDPTSGCWLWVGATSSGYGQLRWDGRTHYAHRVVYELLVGPHRLPLSRRLVPRRLVFDAFVLTAEAT